MAASCSIFADRETETKSVPSNGEGAFKPQSHADLILRSVVFEVFEGSVTEHWRIDGLQLDDVSVGWSAG